MNPRQPNVSVAIPVYNGAAYLGEAIDSVLRQSYIDFELIICDDHSTDTSRAIAASRSDPRIRLLQNERNLGFGGNWNRCLAEARGRYIKILPQDDLLHPDCLAKQVEVLDDDRDAAIALVFCARTIVSGSGVRLLARGQASPQRLSAEALARRIAWRGTNPIGEPGAVLFRHTAAQSAGRFRGERPFVIDIDYWLRLLSFGDAVSIPDPLASFRVSAQSHSVRMAGRQASEFAAFLADIRRQGRHGLGSGDVAAGKAMAILNGLGRAVVYRLAMGKER